MGLFGACQHGHSCSFTVTNAALTRKYGIHRHTVAKWRQRGSKVGIQTWCPVIGRQVRNSNELAKLLRSAG